MFRRDIEEIRGNIDTGRYGTVVNMSQMMNNDRLGNNIEFVLPPVAESPYNDERESEIPVLDMAAGHGHHRAYRTDSSASAPHISRVIRRLMLERRRLQRQLNAREKSEYYADPMYAMRRSHKALEKNFLLRKVLEAEAKVEKPLDEKARDFAEEIFYSTIYKK